MVHRTAPFSMTFKNPERNFQGHAILWRWIYHKRLKIRPQANRKPHPRFRMVPVWMTFSVLFKVTIIQHQITRKWYNIELYLQWPTNRKSEKIMIYRTAPFAMTLNDPYRGFKVTAFFDAEYLRNATRHIVSMKY